MRTSSCLFVNLSELLSGFYFQGCFRDFEGGLSNNWYIEYYPPILVGFFVGLPQK